MRCRKVRTFQVNQRASFAAVMKQWQRIKHANAKPWNGAKRSLGIALLRAVVEMPLPISKYKA
jgi:hypothetical protein